MAHIKDSKLKFETSEEVKVAPTFEAMGLKEDLLRGIYAYSEQTSIRSRDLSHG